MAWVFLTCERFEKSPQWLIETVRIGEALKELSKQDGRLYEVCKRVGYMNHKTFRRAFKKRLGITPSEFREMVSKDKDGTILKEYLKVVQRRSGENVR